MDTTSLLTAALQLPDLWRVPGVEFRDGGGRQVQAAHHDRLRARLTFPLPRDGIQRGVVPGAWRAGQVWRHLNFFQHKAFIHADVPRVSHARGMTSER